MEKPAFSVAQYAVAPIIGVHSKTEATVKDGACFNVVAWDNRGDAVTRLFRHSLLPSGWNWVCPNLKPTISTTLVKSPQRSSGIMRASTSGLADCRPSQEAL